MIELWRGNANAWECDELGHMNVRFYLAKAMEAVANLSDRVGLLGTFREDATATLIPGDIHIRFLAEARPGAPLVIEGGFTALAARHADLVLVMKHAGLGKIAATIRMRIAHASPNIMRTFEWPARFHALAQTLTVAVPEIAQARGLEESPASDVASLRAADDLDLEQIGMGRFNPADMDVFGRMRPDLLLGRVSDSVVNFRGCFPEEWDFHQGKGKGRSGSALLECRILPRRWPRAGDGYVIRSGLRAAGPKVRNLVHWVLDPSTGEPWWTMEGVAAPMDLDARKLIEPTDEIRSRLEAALKPDIRA